MSKLYPVKINKHDTCYTYVLKRTGQATLENLLMSSEEFCSRSRISSSPDNPEVGDIYVTFFENFMTLDIDTEITESGQIIENKVNLDRHFVVYEGDGLVSEACTTTDSTYGLRIRRFEDIKDNYSKVEFLG